MAAFLWPIAAVLIALLVWDALRRYLSRDELVGRVKGHSLQLELNKKSIQDLQKDVAEFGRIASAARDKLAADNAARGLRRDVELPKFRFDRPQR